MKCLLEAVPFWGHVNLLEASTIKDPCWKTCHLFFLTLIHAVVECQQWELCGGPSNDLIPGNPVWREIPCKSQYIYIYIMKYMQLEFHSYMTNGGCFSYLYVVLEHGRVAKRWCSIKVKRHRNVHHGELPYMPEISNLIVLKHPGLATFMVISNNKLPFYKLPR